MCPELQAKDYVVCKFGQVPADVGLAPGPYASNAEQIASSSITAYVCASLIVNVPL